MSSPRPAPESAYRTAYRVDDVRRAERAALATVPEGALMQRAATAVATAAVALLRHTGDGLITGRSIVLLVGAGSNGGDALWAGARLARRGAAVTALLTSESSHAEGLAGLRAAGGRVVAGDAPEAVQDRVLAAAELVVDGLVGLGGRPGLRELPARLVDAIPDGVPVVAVDLPSGVDPDTGELPAAHVRADVTVTFGALKPCLLLPPASVAAGRIEPVDLDFELPPEPLVERLTAADVARLWPVPEASSDKYRRGVLGAVVGSTGYPGAAVLAVSGAARAGLGMIRYLGPDDVTNAVRAAWPEIVAGPGRVQAWLLGSGVNPDADDDQPGRIRKAVEESDEPAVLDAGAISVLTAAGELTAGIRSGHSDRSDRFLLTPHAGELSRLLGDLGEPAGRERVEAQPYRHAHRAAALTGAVVLLKGATTIVVRPDGRARTVAEAPPWLATAGAGDVLAGIIGALLSGGLSPFDAGAVGAFVHGRAASAASGGGPIVAADVATHVPRVVAALLNDSGVS